MPLNTSDVFAGFYCISATKKLCYLLLPVIEPVASGEDIVVGTAFNSASLSKFYSIQALAVGNLFALILADMLSGSYPEGPNFSLTDSAKFGNFFPPNSNPTGKFKFVKFPTISPLTYGSTVIKGKLSNDSVGDAIRHILETSGPLWIKLISEW